MLQGGRRVPAFIGVFAVIGSLFFAYSVVTPVLAEFDEFGYNYNARLFNGWYGYYDRVINGGWVEGTGDAWLLMKWSHDWIPMEDEPVGAWCTNHWTWYSDDYDEETWFGWFSRVTWNEETAPVATYMVKEVMKIMKVSDDPEAWEAYEDGGAYSAEWGTYDSGVPKYVVYQDTLYIYYSDDDCSAVDPIATYDLCTTTPRGLGQPIF